ncbi:MAG: Flp pilus assembly complex ATPase component TadA, partial [Phycisphaeraceae bacterium]|nr:Flp pilus assembly complex ATPase component TadA [Phycisphaeraceae bacterium]
MARSRKTIGEILKRWGLVDDRQLEEATGIAQGSQKKVGDILVDLGYATQNDVAKALAAQLGMEFVDLDQPNVINKDHFNLIPLDLIRKYQILPLGKDNGRIKVLVHDPNDLALLDDLRFRLGADIDTALGARDKIKEYIDTVFSETRATIDEEVRRMTLDATIDRGASLDIQFKGEGDEETGDENQDAQQAPIVKLVNEVIKEAVMTRASDIHVEPFEDRVRLRYRIDGVCHERDRIPKRTQGSVIARLKILAGVKVEEKRIPQDGRIKMKVGGEVIDFRVSFCPAYHGESVVLRILRPESARIGLKNLGMNDDTLETFNSIIRRPNGIFLVTGPTGSGKTTTLYTAL